MATATVAARTNSPQEQPTHKPTLLGPAAKKAPKAKTTKRKRAAMKKYTATKQGTGPKGLEVAERTVATAAELNIKNPFRDYGGDGKNDAHTVRADFESEIHKYLTMAKQAFDVDQRINGGEAWIDPSQDFASSPLFVELAMRTDAKYEFLWEVQDDTNLLRLCVYAYTAGKLAALETLKKGRKTRLIEEAMGVPLPFFRYENHEKYWLDGLGEDDGVW